MGDQRESTVRGVFQQQLKLRLAVMLILRPEVHAWVKKIRVIIVNVTKSCNQRAVF